VPTSSIAMDTPSEFEYHLIEADRRALEYVAHVLDDALIVEVCRREVEPDLEMRPAAVGCGDVVTGAA
jgi:hypothetical protein